ncbi:unnamed protein product [Cylindrotheca closterium]|uniref:WD40 repeat-like protein n=1 Tax=Cylindrotheca closterium TaxID=2856 RepID=A0AAD2FFA8_9STRA|nr:unnamed protein product [Cylindrotheca closterium]
MASSTIYSPSLVVVSGPIVTAWKCLENGSKPQALHPCGETPIADIAWNHNAQVIATISKASSAMDSRNNIVLTVADTGNRVDSLQHDLNWGRPPASGTSIAFGGKSRYIAVGDNSGAVCLWDLKKRMRVREFFHDGYPSLQVAVDPSDKFIHSLTSEFLSIFNLKDATLSGNISPQSSHLTFTRCHTSPLEVQKTAIGTNDGSIFVYDTYRQSDSSSPLLTLDRRFSGKITGLSFSAVNSQLLSAASADGSLQFFDIRTGETIQELASLSSPITSLAMHAGGINCAVGTASGDVLVHDLRQIEPLATMPVQHSVTSLQFAPIPKPKRDKTTSMTTPLSNTLGMNLERKQSASTTPSRQTVKTEVISNSLPRQRDTFSSEPSSLMGYSSQQISPAREPQPQSSQMPFQEYRPTSIPRDPSISGASNIRDPSIAGGVPENEDAKKSSDTGTIQLDDVRDIVQDEVENLRDDMEEAMRNLHMDMINQFHQQSQELTTVMSAQAATIERLTEENRRLQEENVALRK